VISRIRIIVAVAVFLGAVTYAGGFTEKFYVLLDQELGQPIESSPAIGDINGDGRAEIVVGCKDGRVYAVSGSGSNLSGWPISTGDAIQASPAIGDIDGDGRAEVVIGSDDGKIYALESNGRTVPGWPVVTGSIVRSTPAIADLNGDGTDDVIVGSDDGNVYALDGSGGNLFGWPVTLGGGVQSSPAVADVDNDDELEVVVGADDGNVYLIDNNGSIVPGWPVETRYFVRSSPAIGDIDNDGSPEIVVGSDDFNVYAWNANGSLVPGWPTVTEYKISIASPALVDLNGDKKLDVVVGSGDNVLYAWDGQGELLSGFPITTDGRLYNSSPAVADIDGDGSMDIVVGSEDMNLYVFDAYGSQHSESPYMMAGPIHSSPALGDVDGDGILEMVVATMSGDLVCFDLRGSATLASHTTWPQFHHSRWKTGAYGYAGGVSFIPEAIMSKLSDPKLADEFAGDITVEFEVRDPQGHAVEVKCMYSDDWGHTWHEATVSGATSGLRGGLHTLTWRSGEDLKGPMELSGELNPEKLADEWREYREQKDVMFKIVPENPFTTGKAAESNLMHIDNNNPPRVNIKPIEEEQSEDVYVDYEILDEEHDLVSLTAQYSLDGGATWNEATIDGTVLDIRAERYEGSLTWVSDTDMPHLDSETVSFKLVPQDNDPGFEGVVEPVHVDNNAVAEIVLAEIMEEVGGEIAVEYDILDDEGDTLNLVCEFSVDAGETWAPATVTGADGITPSSYKDRVLWSSRTDTLGVDTTAAQFRITPVDNDEGRADETANFHLDNNDLPTIAIFETPGEQSGPIEISYRIEDPEGDAVTLTPEYYDPDRAEWRVATVAGMTSDIPASGYAGHLVWDSTVDMLGYDVADAKFRVTPADNDVGEASEGPPIYVDNNSIPGVLLTDFTTEQSGDVTVNYTLTDLERDTLSVAAEYSTDGGSTWSPAAVSGVTTGIAAGAYAGNITWHSDRDTMHMHVENARFRIIPSDNDVGTPGSTSDFIVDNNNPPSVNVSSPGGEQTGVISVPFTIIDDEGDAVNITCEFSEDGGHTWIPATVDGRTEGLIPGSHSISWTSGEDVPGVDDEDILFRVTAADYDIGEPADSPPIHVDNSEPPTIDVADLEGEQSGDIVIDYTLYDPENDVINIKPEFSEDGGSTWWPATVDGVTEDIYSSGYLGSLVWRSDRDMGGTDQTDIAFRITPYDNDEGAPGRTVNFHLDNNELSTISVDTPTGKQTGNVEITYRLQDPESDASAIAVEYSVDDGFTWKEATVATRTEIDPTRYSGTIIWASDRDEPSVDRTDVRFRVTPLDNDEGLSDTTGPFHLDNNDVPSITLSSVSGELTGDVEFTYDISDADGNDVDLSVEFSADGGSTWNEATVTGATSVISQADYRGSFTWSSFADVAGVDSENVMIRVTPYDNDPGEPAITSVMHVDNNDPPMVSVANVYEEQSGEVTIDYNLSDTESDNVDIKVEYSVDGGSTWREPTLSGSTTGIGSSGYLGTVTWLADRDIKGTDTDDALVRITASDKDTGSAGATAPFHVDVNDPPTVSVRGPAEVGRDIVSIAYTISDAEGDPVDLSCEYSLDGGITWEAATVSGAVSGISSVGYGGSLQWDARADIAGMDSSDIQFRITPSDADEGEPGVSTAFRTDVNDPPTVAIQPLEGEQGDEIIIDYDLEDAEGDVLSVKAEYSSDGGATWRTASVTGDTSNISSLAYSNSLIWDAKRDLGSVDTGAVQFRITPADNDTGASDALTAINVDTNRLPAIEIEPAATDATGDVEIRYRLTDDEGDPVNLTVEYSADGGFTFESATVDGSTSGLRPGPGSFVWRATADGAGMDLADAVVRVTPADNDVGETAFTLPFRVDNNHPPTVSVEPLGNVEAGEAEVRYHLADDEGDPVSIVAEFSTDGGATWKPATAFGVLSDLGPQFYDGSLTWAAGVDIPGKELSSVVFRIVPYDFEEGTPGVSGTFSVDTNFPPEVFVADVIGEQETDTIPIDYSIMDNEGDTVSLICEYSTDGGSTWRAATMSGSTTSISPSAYFGSVDWRVAVDLGSGYSGDVVFRMTAKDSGAGEPAENSSFPVDLNKPPRVSLTSYTEDATTGDITVSYSLDDPENDTVDLDCEYSEDGGATWYPATVSGASGVRGSGSVTWKRLVDVPTVFEGSRVFFRATPYDEDEGEAGQIEVPLQPAEVPEIEIEGDGE
jgi:hypothetical protein